MTRIRVVSTALFLALSAASTLGACASTAAEYAASGASRSAGAISEDGALTVRIKTALQAAGASTVQVTTTQGGIVQLAGFVDNPADAQRAAEVARQVKGVKEVYNDIRVAPGP